MKHENRKSSCLYFVFPLEFVEAKVFLNNSYGSLLLALLKSVTHLLVFSEGAECHNPKLQNLKKKKGDLERIDCFFPVWALCSRWEIVKS